MTYGTIYQPKHRLEDKDRTDFGFSPCFGGNYTNASALAQIDIYVLDNYKIPGINYGHYLYTDNIVSGKDLQDYAKYLLKMGLKFELSRTKINIRILVNNKTELYPVEGWKFKMIIAENSNISCLIFMNAVRYLYEAAHIGLVKDFLLLAKSRVKENLINKFMIAHKRRNYSWNHSLNNAANYLMGLYTDEEFKEQILESKVKVQNSGMIKKLNRGISFIDQEELKKAFETNNPKTIITTYKNIYAKYKN